MFSDTGRGRRVGGLGGVGGPTWGGGVRGGVGGSRRRRTSGLRGRGGGGNRADRPGAGGGHGGGVRHQPARQRRLGRQVEAFKSAGRRVVHHPLHFAAPGQRVCPRLDGRQVVSNVLAAAVRHGRVGARGVEVEAGARGRAQLEAARAGRQRPQRHRRGGE